MNRIWKACFAEMMEKSAFLGGALLYGGLTALDVRERARQMKQNVQLNPLQRDTQFKLQPASAFQFEGGKHMPLKETRLPQAHTLYT